MKGLPIRGFGLAAALTLAASSALAQQIGPDVVVADLHNTQNYGTVGDLRAYAIGTVSCNFGDMDLQWISSTNRHPVIGQNLYRLKDGRFEQLGLSWLKHGFITIDSGICGICPPNGTGNHLSPGCSDPYGASLNGDRGRLGPRYQVNATSGFYNYPFDNTAPVTNLLSRRLIVRDADVDPAQNAGALYFIEGQYVAGDDAEWGNQWNNASYRRVTISGSRNLGLAAPTQQLKPAIHAWKEHGLGPNQPDPDVHLVSVDVPDDGRFWVATKATDNGNGTWHYEYTVHNLYSHRSGGSLSIPIPRDAKVTGVGFKDVDYHSGEPWDTTDWTIAVSANSITWSSPETYAENQQSNALRWGTMYNFWFDVDAPPVEGEIELGLFRPGTPSSVAVAIQAPDSTSGLGDMNCDGVTDAFDIEAFIVALTDPNAYATQYPGCDINNGDINGDGAVDAFDIEGFIQVLVGP